MLLLHKYNRYILYSNVLLHFLRRVSLFQSVTSIFYLLVFYHQNYIQLTCLDTFFLLVLWRNMTILFLPTPRRGPTTHRVETTRPYYVVNCSFSFNREDAYFGDAFVAGGCGSTLSFSVHMTQVVAHRTTGFRSIGLQIVNSRRRYG